nr:hypothetical protein [Tissierella sp.]
MTDKKNNPTNKDNKINQSPEENKNKQKSIRTPKKGITHNSQGEIIETKEFIRPNINTTSSPTFVRPVPNDQRPETGAYTRPTPTQTGPAPTYTRPTPTQTGPAPTYTRPTPTQTSPTPPYTRPTPTQTSPTPTYTRPTPSTTVGQGDNQDKPPLNDNEDNSLIPVKGIDVKRRGYLNQIGIKSSLDLLQRGRTIEQRKSIALDIMNMEIGIQKGDKNFNLWNERYKKYVSSWVKQINLWGIREMDFDTAYLLVELGVRHIEDLIKVDGKKAFDIMTVLHNSQPEFKLITLEKLENLISNSKKNSGNFEYQERFIEKLDQSFRKKLSTRKVRNRSRESLEIQRFKKLLLGITIDDIIGVSSIECDDPAPTFLFRDNINDSFLENTTDSIEVIQKGLGYLQEIELTLPLPRTLRGTIYMLRSGETLPDNLNARDEYALYDALVEVIGISSSSEDKTEDSSNPQGYTDSKGNFIIMMPDKYNMQEAVTIVISKGSNKQKFILGASDIINHVDKQKILKLYNKLDVIVSDIQESKEKQKFIESISYNNEILIRKDINNKERPATNEEEIRYKLLLPKKHEIDTEITSLEKQKAEIEEFINESDDTTTDLERILRNLTLCENLVSDFSAEPFVLNENIFKGYRSDHKKVLPSVKLMENNNKSIYLPTDIAPSRVFNYSMLQRLVEPAISPLADPIRGKARVSMNQGIDVMDFKEKISKSPETWPQMSSLGIGYVLNMHQAWIPDGFALGNLLYSLVLAPGEEQRLVVREKSQSYSVTDKMDGSDSVFQNYSTSQFDNTTAAYEYALGQMTSGDSNYNYSSKTSSFGMQAGASYGGAMLGLSGGFSKTSGKASSAASQSNAHNEASNAAQGFQHEIKTSSERLSNANRLNISMATANESDSVATRIIANHNHSHSMTIQYWEVMRLYRLETCVDSVDLVLFVPLKLINFLKNQEYQLESSDFDRSQFNNRYRTILKFADALEGRLPNKYKNGLSLITKYASYPKWKFESIGSSQRRIKLSFKGLFLSFDDINVTMILKNGKGIIAGDVRYERKELYKKHETTSDIKEAIKKFRNQNTNLVKCECEFTLPSNVTDDDLSYVVIEHSCDELKYVLHAENVVVEGLDKDGTVNKTMLSDVRFSMMHKQRDLAKDNDNSAGDIKNIEYYKAMLPESWLAPNVTITSRELKLLGGLRISDIDLTNSANNKLTAMSSSSTLLPSIYLTISTDMPTLRYSQLQEIEQTVHHIVSNTMKYSQVIWGSLSSDERALMLEQYTIDMDDNKNIDNTEKVDKNDRSSLPLLNCINVQKLLGFYGNCMLFPFTFPKKFSENVDKTAVELQDSLYNYHTNYFRVPSTVISMPTDGMIGEAVLGETNVSEEIDLTRFWNWKDSPIDNMSLDSTYLSNTDYLAGKGMKDNSVNSNQGSSSGATGSVTTADLVSALIAKQTPNFDNITGLDKIKSLLNGDKDTAAKGRNDVLEGSRDLTKKAIEEAGKAAKAAEESKKEEKSNSEKSEKNEKNPDKGKASGESTDKEGKKKPVKEGE